MSICLAAGSLGMRITAVLLGAILISRPRVTMASMTASAIAFAAEGKSCALSTTRADRSHGGWIRRQRGASGKQGSQMSIAPRKDLARREQEDFTANREITVAQFRQRCAQILRSYEERRPGQEWSRLEKLIRGMPKRLAKCKARRYGRCGK